MVDKFVINNLRDCPLRSPRPGYVPTSNGCGSEGGNHFPNNPTMGNDSTGPGNFLAACNNHDICYGTCNSIKYQCDSNFLSEMNLVCNTDFALPLQRRKCLYFARLYGSAVAFVGGQAYEDGQKAACTCCP